MEKEIDVLWVEKQDREGSILHWIVSFVITVCLLKIYLFILFSLRT